MPQMLRTTLEDLAAKFSADVLAAIKEMSLDEVMAFGSREMSERAEAVSSPTGAPRFRKGQRRTSKDVDATVNAIIRVLESKPGLRAEQIRAQLGLTRKDIDRPILHAIAAGRIKKTGERRATRYYAR